MLPKAIEAELAKLDKFREDAIALTGVAEVAHAIAAEFPDMAVDVSILRHVARTKPFVNIRVDILGFDDVLPLFRALAAKGWHTDKANTHDDYAELERRTYNLIEAHEEATPDVTGEITDRDWFPYRLRLMAFLSDGAKCRKVQVGTKVEPVYELQCG